MSAFGWSAAAHSFTGTYRSTWRTAAKPWPARSAAEVTHVFGHRVAPEGTAVENPAFDVTPSRYVTAIITERGVARAPYETSLKELAR